MSGAVGVYVEAMGAAGTTVTQSLADVEGVDTGAAQRFAGMEP